MAVQSSRKEALFRKNTKVAKIRSFRVFKASTKEKIDSSGWFLPKVIVVFGFCRISRTYFALNNACDIFDIMAITSLSVSPPITEESCQNQRYHNLNNIHIE